MKLNPIVGAIAGVAAGAAVVVFVLIVLGTASSSKQNAETLQLIKDCTIKPAGKCQQIQREQSKAFARIVALANVCTDRPGHQTVAQVERCIRRGMTDE